MPKPSPTKKTAPTTKADRKTSLNTSATGSNPKTDSPPHASTAALRDTKQSRLISLLRPRSGATIEQMVKTTGWQAHRVRGIISGVLR